jgi:hypothetical protein
MNCFCLGSRKSDLSIRGIEGVTAHRSFLLLF